MAEQISSNTEHRPVTPDSIDKELDWLIEKDDKNMVKHHDSDTDETIRRNSPLPLDHRDDLPVEKSTSYTGSPYPPSPSHDQHQKRDYNRESDTQAVSSSQDEPSTPREFPARDSLAMDSTGEGSGTEDDEYLSYSDGQRKANDELTSMKLDLGYTDEEPPPEYDVAERVRKLNEELANEPPPENEKERSIKFRENLVDVVPPASVDESDDDAVHDQEDHTKSPRDQYSSEDSTTPRSELDTGAESPHSNSSADTDEQGQSTDRPEDSKVVVERNGKFNLVNVEDLTAEERELYQIPDSPQNSEGSVEHKPKPPNHPRPKTSGGDGMARGQGHNSRRIQSAKSRPQLHSEWNEEFTYQSPYAMSKELKKELAEKKRQEERKRKEEQEHNPRDRSRENDDAFKAWLRKKREQASQRNRSDSQQKNNKDSESSDENAEAEKAYKEWLKIKKQQIKKEKEIQRQEQKEYNEGWYVRPREECDRAYREWLKKKNAEIKRQREEDKQRARIHRLWLRRSRKSQQLAKAIKQAQAFRYVDYYGYRF